MSRVLCLRYVARLLYASWGHANRACFELEVAKQPRVSPYVLWKRALDYLVEQSEAKDPTRTPAPG